MEIDRSIALYQKEQWEREKEELRQQEKDKYDPKLKITYSLEELIAGIKSGKQYLYTLKLNFEPQEILDGQLKVPYITDFFDLIEEGPDNVLWGSNKRRLSVMIMRVPCEKMKQPFNEWVSQAKKELAEVNLRLRVLHTQTLNRMEYFCYELPTSEGRTYNINFRYPKDKIVYIGGLNCMNEDRGGMGLMLEALVHVVEELNR